MIWPGNAVSPHQISFKRLQKSCYGKNTFKSTVITPPKFNIAPEKWWLEDYFPVGKVTFQGLCWTLRGYLFLKALLKKSWVHDHCIVVTWFISLCLAVKHWGSQQVRRGRRRNPIDFHHLLVAECERFLLNRNFRHFLLEPSEPPNDAAGWVLKSDPTWDTKKTNSLWTMFGSTVLHSVLRGG